MSSHFDKIQQLASALNKTIENEEKMLVSVLAKKASKNAGQFPYDQTIGAMSIVLSRMEENNKIFISRAELKDLYNKSFSRNTRFAEIFKSELGELNKLASSKYAEKHEEGEVATYEGDSVLINALDAVFDNNASLKMYSKKAANKAEKTVMNTFEAWNIRPNHLGVEAGNEKLLIVRADYETPKGLTSVFVPVLLNKEEIVDCDMFVGNSATEEINNTNVKNYLLNNAGLKLNIKAESLLELLSKAAVEQREVSAAELALTRLNAKKANTGEFSGQIIGLELNPEPIKDVEVQKSSEFSSFEKVFESPAGKACVAFGKEKVKMAGNVIARELTSFGFKNPQIAVAKSDKNSVFYSVALDGGRLGFTVPMKMDKITLPNVMLCNGSVMSFNKDEINNLKVENITDYQAAALASPLCDTKPSQLVNEIRAALKAGNYMHAEDALNVLASAGDEKAYAVGLDLFLHGQNVVETEKSTCSNPITSKASQHPICSHTGLPIHKVYQDKMGNCRPLHRRGQEESKEGGFFMNSKVFV